MIMKCLSFLFVAFVYYQTLPAQVTIGSNHQPNKGSLLDLKEEQLPDGLPNSERGVNLPRVALTDMKKV